MAAQALLSGRQLLGRPVQSAVSRSSARKAPFVVRASSSPPAKVCALPYLLVAPTIRPSSTSSIPSSFLRGLLSADSIVFVSQQGADRQLWFASKQSLSYLDGTYVPALCARPHARRNLQHMLTRLTVAAAGCPATMGSTRWGSRTRRAPAASSSPSGWPTAR
jgi:hypothetical protein